MEEGDVKRRQRIRGISFTSFALSPKSRVQIPCLTFNITHLGPHMKPYKESCSLAKNDQ